MNLIRSCFKRLVATSMSVLRTRCVHWTKPLAFSVPLGTLADLTRSPLPEKRHSSRRRHPGSEDRGCSVRWCCLLPSRGIERLTGLSSVSFGSTYLLETPGFRVSSEHVHDILTSKCR